MLLVVRIWLKEAPEPRDLSTTEFVAYALSSSSAPLLFRKIAAISIAARKKESLVNQAQIALVRPPNSSTHVRTCRPN